MSLTLQDYYRGRTKKIKIQRKVLCKGCKGKGSLKDGAVKKCDGCQGRGIRVIMQRMGPMIQQSQTTCTDCSGTGEVINPTDRCRECNGRKTQPESEIIEVQVTRGNRSNISFHR